MKNLLRADLYRIRHSKLTLVMLILCVGFPLLMSLLYWGMDALALMDMEPADEAMMEEMTLFNGKSLIANSFTLSNNLGLVIPIFSGIFICLDISDGTLRNKIINGCERRNIYLSHLLSGMIFNVAAILLYTVFNCMFGCLFLGGYGPEINGEEVKYLVVMICVGVLTFAFVATLTTFIAMVMKNLPLTMILTVAFGMLISMTSLLGIGLIDLGKYAVLLNLIPGYLNANMGDVSTILGTPAPAAADVLCGVLSYLVFGALNTVLGMLIFQRSDLK